MNDVIQNPPINNRRARIRTLRLRVQTRHQRMVQRGQNIVLPLAGLAAGLLLPLASRSDSLNPARQVSGFIKRSLSRLVSIAVVETVLLAISAKTPAILNEQPGSKPREIQ